MKNKIIITVVGITALAVILGGVFLYQQTAEIPEKDKCGDGFCGEIELSNPDICPQDCETNQDNVSPQQGKCGDGVCDGKELKNPKLCPEDCEKNINIQSSCQNFPPPNFCPNGPKDVVVINTDENGCSVYGCEEEPETVADTPSKTKYVRAQQDKCGDGVCYEVEKTNLSLCPEDCENNSGINTTVSTSGVDKSEVKVVDGIPRLFINGEVFDGTYSQIYYYPSASTNSPTEIEFGDEWVSEFKTLIDQLADSDTKIVLLHVWWSELDESTKKPNNIIDNLNFGPLDEVMDYAFKKSVYIMLLPEMHKMIPKWWLTENKFPSGLNSPCIPTEKETDTSCIPKEICSEESEGPRCCDAETQELLCCNIKRDEITRVAKTTDNGELYCSSSSEEVPYKQCEFCETDAYGWKFNYPSMGNNEVRSDYGEYLTAIINRYKVHPALVGWGFGIGSTAEDIYGPDYTQLMFVYHDLYVRADDYQLADYSPFFQKEFKEYLINKYRTDDKIKDAWNDNTIILNDIKIPHPKEFFKANVKEIFPDNFNLNIMASLNNLTQKGLDFYEFRESMKKTDHDYYTSLFKTLDPNHVLYFSTWNNEDLYSNDLVDGFWSNPRVNAERDTLTIPTGLILSQQLGIMHGKAVFTIIENIPSAGDESQAQVDALKLAGKATKCFNGSFGYVSKIEGGADMPDWDSSADIKAIDEVNAYEPDNDCACEFIHSDDTFFNIGIGDILEKFGITGFTECYAQNNETQPSQGRCGDGVCDGPETSLNCYKDCLI